jgi:membrane-bound lytic murein transglycosylase A
MKKGIGGAQKRPLDRVCRLTYAYCRGGRRVQFVRSGVVLLGLLNLNAAHIDRAPIKPPEQERSYTTPTRLLKPREWPILGDDLDFTGLATAIERQAERFKKMPTETEITLGQDHFRVGEVIQSHEVFLTLVQSTQKCIYRKGAIRSVCMALFQDQVMQKYNLYAPDLTATDPRFGEPQPVLFTGYHTPLLDVDTERRDQYRYPIYGLPKSDWFKKLGRIQIDFFNFLHSERLELYYGVNRFDLYLLHVEGGGRVVFRTKTGDLQSRYLSYAGTNQQSWRFVSRKMLDKGWITEPSISAQRKFLKEHPEKEFEVFSYCPGYVFFKETDHPPFGSDDVPLTDGRSIATDTDYYAFKGLLSFVMTERPRMSRVSEMMPFSRFVLDQDTGGAITGKGRVDFYFGEGLYAEWAASSLNGRGDLYFLMLKPIKSSRAPLKSRSIAKSKPAWR